MSASDSQAVASPQPAGGAVDGHTDEKAPGSSYIHGQHSNEGVISSAQGQELHVDTSVPELHANTSVPDDALPPSPVTCECCKQSLSTLPNRSFVDCTKAPDLCGREINLRDRARDQMYIGVRKYCVVCLEKFYGVANSTHLSTHILPGCPYRLTDPLRCNALESCALIINNTQ